MKKLKVETEKVKTKEKLHFKMIVLLVTIVMTSFMSNIVFGAELLVIDDTLYQYIDTDSSNTINIKDKIVLANEVFNVMVEKNGVIYALADYPLNYSGDTQVDSNYYETNNQNLAKNTATKYKDTLIGKGLELTSLKLLSKSNAESWLKYKFYSSSTNIGGSTTTYQKTDETPEFAYKYAYWMDNTDYMCTGTYVTNDYYNGRKATVLPVVAVNSNNFNKQFKIICDDSSVSVSNINNEIHIELEPKNGFVLDSLKAYDSNRNEINIVDNKFIMIRDDVTIETTYKEVFTVTFNTNGGSNIASIENVVSGDKIEEPTVPTKENYTFIGWYKDEELQNAFDFETDTITTNIILYANWEENQPITYTVTFNTNGGNAIADLTNVVSGDKIEEPTVPTKENYTFIGWYKDEELQNAFDFETDTITINTTLYAKWQKNQPTMYEITISATPLAGGNVTGGNTYEENEVVTLNAIANSGYRFIKWTENGEEISTNATYTFTANRNRNLVAEFEGIPVKIIVTFDSNGGSSVESYEFEGFGLYPKIQKPANPTRAGYIFNGWYIDDIEFDFNTVVKESITLVAKWTKKQSTGGGGGGSTITKYEITVQQNENGKITPETIKVNKGKNQTFTIKANNGYEIEDVFVDGKSVGKLEEYTFKNIKEKHTIEAKFKVIEKEEIWKNLFVHVLENDWYYGAVKFVNQKKLFKGLSDTEFGANVTMNRTMIVTVLHRLAGEPKVQNNNVIFDDVENNAYYYEPVIWAVENGIVNGVGNNKFAPQNNVTREQLIVMLYRYAKLNGKLTENKANLSSYDDSNLINSYAKEAFSWAIQEEIITGRTTTTLAPQGIATRAEVATMIMRFSNMINEA